MFGSLDLIIAAGELIVGILFLMGKCKNWIFYNEEMTEKYDEKFTMRFFAILLLVLSVGSWVTVLGGWLNHLALMRASVTFNAVVLVAGTVYFLKGKRFRR